MMHVISLPFGRDYADEQEKTNRDMGNITEGTFMNRGSS